MRAGITVTDDLRAGDGRDAFTEIEAPVWDSLIEGLGHEPRVGLEGPLWNAMNDRSKVIEEALRLRFDVAVLAAISAVKMADDIADLKVLEGIRA